MIDECLMTEDCPGYDRDQRVCLIHPGDCPFLLVDDETVLIVETPEALPAVASAEGVSR